MNHDMLDKRWCDLYEDATNTQTVREWIHDSFKYLHGIDISDEELDEMPDDKLTDFIDDLDYLLGK